MDYSNQIKPNAAYLDDHALTSAALDMRANYIETGSVEMSRADVDRQLQRLVASRAADQPRAALLRAMLRPLSPADCTMVVRLRHMAEEQRSQHQAKVDRMTGKPLKAEPPVRKPVANLWGGVPEPVQRRNAVRAHLDRCVARFLEHEKSTIGEEGLVRLRRLSVDDLAALAIAIGDVARRSTGADPMFHARPYWDLVDAVCAMRNAAPPGWPGLAGTPHRSHTFVDVIRHVKLVEQYLDERRPCDSPESDDCPGDRPRG